MQMILETHDLTKVYANTRAASKINIHIEKGQIYGLVGRNGAGKTTIMRMLSGLSNPTSGTFRIMGEEGLNNPKTRGQIGCLIESPGIFAKLSARDNLILKCKALGVPKPKKAADALLEQVGLASVGKKHAGDFSLGMRQRLGIALALVGNPAIVILDEPINGLDPQGIVEVREIIEKLNRELGLTFVISSHLLDELSKIATKYGIIHNGELMTELTAEELESKCTKKVMLKVDNAVKAVVVLREMGIENYEVTGANSIDVFEGLERTAEINRALCNADIGVSELTIQNETLENFYLTLTGGVRHA